MDAGVNLQCIVIDVFVDLLQRLRDLLLDERMVLEQLLRDVLLVVAFKVIDVAVVLDHFDDHVRYAQAENVVLILRVSDFGNRAVQQIMPHLVVEVVVSVFVQLVQV